MDDNCNPVLHQVKRALSRYEKSSVITTGRAVVMPGSPPRHEDHQGEIEELWALGFSDIHGVESDPEKAVDLYDHYYDLASTHYEEIGAFLLKAQRPFSYVHFDFCAQLNREEIAAVQSAKDKLTPTARVRVSSSTTRRMTVQLEYEEWLRRTVLLRLVERCSALDPGSPRWDMFREELESSTDTTQVVIGVLLLNYMFGFSVEEFIDLMLDNNEPLPAPKGKYTLANIERWTYAEPQGRTQMHTCWADLVPRTTRYSTAGQLLDQVSEILRRIVLPVPHFNPDFFLEHT